MMAPCRETLLANARRDLCEALAAQVEGGQRGQGTS